MFAHRAFALVAREEVVQVVLADHPVIVLEYRVISWRVVIGHGEACGTAHVDIARVLLVGPPHAGTPVV